VDDQLTESELRQTALSLQLKPSDVQSLQPSISSFGTSPTLQRLAEFLKFLRVDDVDKDDVEGYVESYPEG